LATTTATRFPLQLGNCSSLSSSSGSQTNQILPGGDQQPPGPSHPTTPATGAVVDFHHGYTSLAPPFYSAPYRPQEVYFVPAYHQYQTASTASMNDISPQPKSIDSHSHLSLSSSSVLRNASKYFWKFWENL